MYNDIPVIHYILSFVDVVLVSNTLHNNNNTGNFLFFYFTFLSVSGWCTQTE